MRQDPGQTGGLAKLNPVPAADKPGKRAFVAGINPREPQDARLLDSLVALGFEVYLLAAKDLSRSLRELDCARGQLTAYPAAATASLPGIPASPYAAPQAAKLPRGLLLLAGLDRDSLNLVLDHLREQQLSGLALKAVVTEHNLDWPVQTLANELGREHGITTAYVRLRRQVKHLPEPADPAQRQALAAAQALLGNLAELSDAGPLLEALRQLALAYDQPGRAEPDL